MSRVAVPAPAGVFGDGDEHNGEQHRLLSLAYDPFTIDRLKATGIGPGWRCLDAGAGNGSVAAWLAQRVGPTGSVTATDLHPARVPDVDGLRVVEHDIVRDPLPEGEFDLVHARLLLRLLPERLAVLDRLVRALKPGRVLQIDEFDATDAPCLQAPDAAARALYRTFTATKNRLMTRRNVAIAFGRQVADAMSRARLADVTSHRRLELWNARSPGLRLLAHHTRHLRDELVQAGMTDRQLAEVRTLLAHPGFRACSYAMYSVQGRRPEEVR
ncbi:class I SAM-dependent methyltransferase [Actinomadura violacea]|uniref:class I SAM-dependent methyltransferase n=1 Tax=Actinomadura violacea TaxID=2819934 RepID=UPI0027DDB13D|nr:class I SAM-dependent methyltransferase [Actinomadura violacea]